MRKNTALKWSIAAVLSFAGLTISGCAGSDSDNYGVSREYQVTRSALTGFCSISVKGTGAVDIETDYVPNVTWCENGGSSHQGLRAQAVSARSYGYYKMGTSGTGQVDDGTSDQVYSCPSRAPNDAQFAKVLAASNDTAGIVLRYKNTQVCAFFVAGEKQANLNADCTFSGTATASTQKYVTYNWGKSGTSADGHTQSSIGYRSDKFYANRGCLSQNGSTCLGYKGWAWENIIKFFYGMDIEMVRVEADCVKHPNCTTQLEGDSTIIDDTDECFSRSVSNNYFLLGTPLGSSAEKIGYGDSLQFAYTWDKAASAVGTWKVNVKTAGKYVVYAYIDSKAGALSSNAPYTIRANDVEKTVTVDLSGKSGWVEIGKFDFAAGSDQWVKLTDATGEAYTDAAGKRVLFDALKFEAAQACSDACEKGAKECTDAGYRECGDFNADNCTEWSESKACGEGEKCVSGSCQKDGETCSDECQKGAKECLETLSGWRECGEFDADTCSEWSETHYCGTGMICSDGACVNNPDLTCTNDCHEDEQVCEGDGYKTCGQFDDDECLDWSEVKACAEDEICQNGKCSSEAKGGMPETCLTEVDGEPETIIEETDACFVQSESKRWKNLAEYGHDGSLYYAYQRQSDASAVGTWYLKVTKSGKYNISVYVEAGIGDVPENITYTVRASGKTYHPGIVVDSDGKGGWMNLGNYELTAGEEQYVELSDLVTGEDVDTELRIVYDAIRVKPFGSDSDGDETCSGEDCEDEEEEGYHVTVVSGGSDCSISGTPETSWGWLGMAACLAGLGLIRRRRLNSKLS